MARVFISHSSKDKDIVDKFKNLILNAGIGISDDDIAYTSAPETGVKIGGDIHNFIKDNIESSDFVFFMISENYKSSEICHNEMGAAWALNKQVKPLLIQNNIGFDSIGWLYQVKLCAKINNKERLDEIRDELHKIGTGAGTSVWNRSKDEFLKQIESIFNTENSLMSMVIEASDVETSELGILDYLKSFEDYMEKATVLLYEIADDTTKFAEDMAVETVVINSIAKNFNGNSAIAAVRKVSTHIVSLSNKIGASVESFEFNYNEAIECVLKIEECNCIGEEERMEIKNGLQYIIKEIKNIKVVVAQTNVEFKNLPKIESKFNVSKNKLIATFDKFQTTLDSCLKKSSELLIKY